MYWWAFGNNGNTRCSKTHQGEANAFCFLGEKWEKSGFASCSGGSCCLSFPVSWVEGKWFLSPCVSCLSTLTACHWQGKGLILGEMGSRKCPSTVIYSPSAAWGQCAGDAWRSLRWAVLYAAPTEPLKPRLLYHLCSFLGKESN